jgi:hypothetical protein
VTQSMEQGRAAWLLGGVVVRVQAHGGPPFLDASSLEAQPPKAA